VETKYEDYEGLFKYAYIKGLKGFTTFWLGGSMKGILGNSISSGERPQYIERNAAPKRPKELDCDIHTITVQGKKYMILVGLLNGTVYEIFVDDGIHNITKKQGKTIKKSKGNYKLLIDEKVVIDNIGQAFDRDFGTLSRFISMSLRHGTPLQFVVEQLGRDKNFLGFERAVARVLKKYIKDGEKIMGSVSCGNHECGGDNLIYRDGCKTCLDCGWSACG
jgi:ribonucleoside-diphosphate reductase alpha chain